MGTVEQEKQMDMLAAIFTWAQKEENIRALALTGSRAHTDAPDFLADFDIALFVIDPRPYLIDDSWLRAIGNVWVSIPERVYVGTREEAHTRLVIFEGGVKVDFALFPLDVLNKFDASGNFAALCAGGYKILLDKDGHTAPLGSARLTAQPTAKPTPEEFEVLVKEFFFEVYHVAKYLHRQDLWLVKFRDWSTKEFLLRMLEWHAKTVHGWDYDVRHQGKNMHEWVDPEVWVVLQDCFGHFDAVDSWRALEKTVVLFRRFARETAARLGYTYPREVDQNIMGFVETVKGF